MNKKEIIDILEKNNIKATDETCNIYEKLSKLNEDELDIIDKLIEDRLHKKYDEGKEIHPCCNTCGNDDFPNNFNYEEHYANGYKYICKDCGDAVWLSEKEHEDFY